MKGLSRQDKKKMKDIGYSQSRSMLGQKQNQKDMIYMSFLESLHKENKYPRGNRNKPKTHVKK
jgi:hypothetical protein